MKAQYWILALSTIALALVLNKPSPAQSTTPPPNGRWQIVISPLVARQAFLYDTAQGGSWITCNQADGTQSWCVVPVLNNYSIAPSGQEPSAVSQRGPASDVLKESLPGIK